MMELVVLSRAEGEILETQARLEDGEPGRGDRFNERAEQALDRILSFPEMRPALLSYFSASAHPRFSDGDTLQHRRTPRGHSCGFGLAAGRARHRSQIGYFIGSAQACCRAAEHPLSRP